jgi:predicted ribosomally synthesized peptide with SipW-like signal peptide
MAGAFPPTDPDLARAALAKGAGDGPGHFGKGARAKSQTIKEYGMRNLKKILLSLGAAAAIAALATGGPFAVFTDQESIAGNDIDSGSVEIDLNDVNDGATTPVVDVSNMAIGDSMDGTLKVENAGDNKASFVLTGSWTDSGEADDLDDYVKITITQVGETTPAVNNVALSTFNGGAGVNVGSLVPGASKTYTIDVSLPTRGSNTLDNALQNLEGSETFTVDATQRAGVDHDIDSNPED